MKVLFIPYGKQNPYHHLLSSSLERRGIKIVEGELFRVLPLIRNIIEEPRTRIVHITWTHPFFISDYLFRTILDAIQFIFDVILVKLLGKKIVWAVHNKYNHEKRHVRIDVLVSKIFSKLVDKINVNCSIAKGIIEKLFDINDDSKIEVVPHGNYLKAYENDINQNKAREWLGIGSEKFVFLYFGMIRPYKGVDRLIDSFKSLDSKCDAMLLIVGNPMNKSIEKRLVMRTEDSENIQTVLDYIPEEEVKYYLNASDVVVLPYNDILTSGGVVLAMSFGKPIIAPRMGCIPEVVGEKGSFLYKTDEKQKRLTEALKRSINSKFKLEKMGKYNLERAKELDWDKISKDIKNIYHETLK